MGEDCRMSKWNPIVSGRRGWAALRDLSRRWCLGVGSGLSRRVTANGSAPGAYLAGDVIVEQRADAARRDARTHLGGDRGRMRAPKNATSKFPANSLPGPFSA
jgi:hypothetical protein